MNHLFMYYSVLGACPDAFAKFDLMAVAQSYWEPTQRT